MDKKAIFATGATGLIGSRFVEMFRDKYDVINLDLTTGVDITDPSTFQTFFDQHQDVKVLIHLAAFTDTAKAMAEAGDKNGICYKVNVIGTKNIAQVCKDRGIHMIHISTDFVFDGTKVEPYTEEDLPSPLDWYGETKAIAEKTVVESGATYTIARLSYPYRANYELKPDLVQKIRAKLADQSLPPQFSDTTITPTFVDDLAIAFDKIIMRGPRGILHLVGSSSHSPYDIAKKVAAHYGFADNLVKEGSLSSYLESSNRPFAKTVKMSNQKASKLLDMHFSTFEEGLLKLKEQQIS